MPTFCKHFQTLLSLVYLLSTSITLELVVSELCELSSLHCSVLLDYTENPTMAVEQSLQGARGAGGCWIDTLRARPQCHTVCIRYLKDIPGTVVAKYEIKPKGNFEAFHGRVFFLFQIFLE